MSRPSKWSSIRPRYSDSVCWTTVTVFMPAAPAGMAPRIAAVKSSGVAVNSPNLGAAKKTRHGLGQITDGHPAQRRLKVQDHPWRCHKEITGQRDVVDPPARTVKLEICRNRAPLAGVAARQDASPACRIVDAVDELVSPDLVGKYRSGGGFFGRRDRTRRKVDPQPLGKACHQRVLDLGNRRRPAAEQLAQGHDPLGGAGLVVLGQLGRRNVQQRRPSCSDPCRTSTVPWKKIVSPSKNPPVPEILRPPTSMSLRGR